MPAIAKLIVAAGLVLMLVTGYRAMVCKYHWTAHLPLDPSVPHWALAPTLQVWFT